MNDSIQQDSTSVKVKIMTDMTGQQLRSLKFLQGQWNSPKTCGWDGSSLWYQPLAPLRRWCVGDVTITNLPCAMEWCIGTMYSDTVYDDWVIDWHSIWKSFWINRSSDHSIIGHFFKSHPVDGVLSFVFLGFFQVNASNISQKESLNLEPSQFARVQKESAGENQMQTVREY